MPSTACPDAVTSISTLLPPGVEICPPGSQYPHLENGDSVQHTELLSRCKEHAQKPSSTESTRGGSVEGDSRWTQKMDEACMETHVRPRKRPEAARG